LGNWLKIGVPVIVVAILSITVVSISAEEGLIPSWIKTIAGFWVDGDVSDKEFVSAMEWMIENEVIKVSTTDDDEFKAVAGELHRENQQLKKEISQLENENEKLQTQLDKMITIASTSVTSIPSEPTEFSRSWDISGNINIGGITVNTYQLGFMEPDNHYFGLDVGVTWSRGGNPIELVVSDIAIIEKNGFVHDASDADKKKLSGMYTEDRARRTIVLFDDMPKDFKYLEVVVTVLDRHVVDDSYTFTFPYTFQ